MEELRLQVEVAVAAEISERLVGLQFALKPLDGETELERTSDPWKPFRLVTVTAESAVVPVGKVTVDGLAETAKSSIVTEMVVE